MMKVRTAPRLGAAALIGALSVSGCAYMPSEGPSVDAVVAAHEQGARGEDDFSFALIAVDLDVIERLEQRVGGGVSSLEAAVDGRGPARVVGVGDAISVTIYEASSGGLFSSSKSDGAVGGSNAVTVPLQRVDHRGYVSIPYAGRIRAAGRRPEEIGKRIEKVLAGRAIDPQAIVAVEESVNNVATVMGEGVTGARVPLPGGHERVLDVLAAAGGVKGAPHAVAVRMTRGAAVSEVSMLTLLTDPRENIRVRPGDVLVVTSAERTFTVFGAAGSNSRVPFDSHVVTAEEALAKASGLVDSQSDPEGLFILRYEPVEIVTALDDDALAGPALDPSALVPVAYQFDLRTPTGLFLARRFPMRDKDIVYAASAESNQLRKVFSLIGAILSPATTAVSTGNAVSSIN